MKPVVLALTLALFATLLNLASAGTDAGMQVVASYKGYDKRQFPKIPTLACVSALGWQNMAEEQTVPLGTPTIMIKKIRSPYLQYCKYVTDGFARRGITVSKRIDSISVNQVPRYAFYAQRAADKSPEAITATAAKVVALLEAENYPKKRTLEGIIMVEITATNEVYVGPMDYIAATTRN